MNEESQVEILTQKVTALVELLRVRETVLQGLMDTQQRFKWFSLGIAVSMAFDMILTAMFGIGLYTVKHLQATQTSTSCNLYGLIIPSLSKPQPEQIDTPEKREQFSAFSKVILSDYARLGCEK